MYRLLLLLSTFSSLLSAQSFEKLTPETRYEGAKFGGPVLIDDDYIFVACSRDNGDQSGAVYVNVTEPVWSSVTLFPNPAAEAVFVKFESQALPVEWAISTLEGKEIESGKWWGASNYLPLPETDGVYMLQMQQKNGAKAIKRILKH